MRTRIPSFLFTGLWMSVFAAASEEPAVCVSSNDEKCAAADAADITVHQVGLGSVIVIENFLGDLSVKIHNEISQRKDWKPVVPAHRSAINYETEQTVPDLLEPLEVSVTGFPGLRTQLTEEYNDALKERLEQLDLEKLLDIPRSTINPKKPSLHLQWSDDSFFGNICYHPSKLGLLQRVPHTDEGFIQHPGTFAQDHIMAAVVHYLSPQWDGTGGTGFYEDVASGGSRFRAKDCSALKQRASKLHPRGSLAWKEQYSCYCDKQWPCKTSDSFIARVHETGYQSNDDNEGAFRLLLHVPYKHDRAVIYSAKQLHSAYIDDESLHKLSCNATKGRLTGNVFFS